MKLSKIFLLALVGLLIFSSCSDGGQAEREALRDEVMAIHDEVMPKMGDFRKLQKRIESLSDSLRAMESIDTNRLNDLAARGVEIAAAQEGMMAWMRQYNPEVMQDGTPHEEVMSYLKDQKAAIEKVRDQMIQALSAGEEALK
ncbi:MAG: hypothetical protein RIC80_04020 [Cyclobacteriaceae bacterium]